MNLNINEENTVINGEYIIYHDKPNIIHNVHTGKKTTPEFIYEIITELASLTELIKDSK